MKPKEVRQENIKREIVIYPKISTDKNLEIDNKINLIFYENNLDFSEYSTDIKAIAIYLPNFYPIINKNLLYNNKDYNYLEFLQKIKPIYKGHHQPRIPSKDYIPNYNLAEKEIIKKQINLAKSHGLYGFAIYYYWFSGKTIFEKPLNIIYKEDINFHYMLIWKNEKVTDENNIVLLEEKYEENDSVKFIEDIKKYLIDKKYIRIDGKPIIGIYKPNRIPQLNTNILIWRQKAREFGIGEIFIISGLNGYNIKEINDMKLFDGAYKSPPNDLLEKNVIKNTREYYFYYYGLLYSNIISENITVNFPVYKGSMLEWDNSAINKIPTIFGDYSPEIFYIMNKLLINWTRLNYNEANRFVFINAWNNYFKGTYLEPDEKYGYGSINALSKALFDLTYKNANYNLSNLINNCLVAVQAHIFYSDLINEIINKTNNIPVKFDLYITTDTYQKMEFIKNNVEKYSKCNKFEIKILENKGRDVLPFLIQMGEIIDNYKYFCHIHSKKSLFSPEYGLNWRIHLYANLLGNTEIISEILSDFENYEKLGFIYPDNYPGCVPFTMYLHFSIRRKMNDLLSKLFPGYTIGGKYFDFPAGDMFWARSKAVYQLFKLDLSYLKNEVYSEEKGPKDILYAIERIWLFIVKLNGFYYKKIFKYYT